MNLNSAFARLVFILFLLVAQQQAAVHAISHYSSDVAGGVSTKLPKKQLPGELQCEQCLAFAAIGSALTGSHAQPALPAAPAITGVATPASVPAVARLRAFNPRAPPLFS